MKLKLIQLCESNQPYASAYVMSNTEFGKVYKLMIPFPEASPDEYVCQCEGFKHRGYCSHQRKVHLCLWDSNDNDKLQDEKGICPKCGLDTYEEMRMIDE